MRPVVPDFLVGLEVISGAPLSAIVVAPLSGMVCVSVVEKVVSLPAVKVFLPFPSIYPGFLDVSLSSRIHPLVTWRVFEWYGGIPLVLCVPGLAV